MDERILTQLRDEPKPGLGPFFAARAAARAMDQKRGTDTRLVALWIAVAAAVAAVMWKANWPEGSLGFIIQTAIPASFLVALRGWSGVSRWILRTAGVTPTATAADSRRST